MRHLLLQAARVARQHAADLVEKGKEAHDLLWLAHGVKLALENADGEELRQAIRVDFLACARHTPDAVALPCEATPEHLELWAQVITGLEIDADGAMRPLTLNALAARRQQLAER